MVDISSANLRAILDLYGRRAQQLERAPDQERTGPVRQEEARTQRDGLTISREVQEVLRARDEARSAPDVRQERVQELRQQLQEGSYGVEDEEIAQSLLEFLTEQDLA